MILCSGDALCASPLFFFVGMVVEALTRFDDMKVQVLPSYPRNQQVTLLSNKR